MKYLLVFSVIAVVFWIWRSQRQSARIDAEKTAQANDKTTQLRTPQEMLQCAVCAVHLPAGDAIVGRKGSYCSVAHQKQLEN
jgi:uncharacterized protein